MKKFKPGISFADFVVPDFLEKRSRVQEVEIRDYRRGWLVWVVVIVLFGGLLVRLAVLQIFQGGTYRVLADENRIKQIKIIAPRGMVFDRNGVEIRSQEATAHVVGYVGEISEDEVGLFKLGGQKYEGGDLVGRMGLEEYYETRLHGIDGGRLVEVDNLGKEVRELGMKVPVRGQTLKTTLDLELSRVATKGLKNKKGAVVISVPKTGEILGLVSSPRFDPKKIENALADNNLPLFNRAITGTYPPGSTFKMVVTAAAIDSGRVKRDFTFEDKGIMTVGSFKYTNWLFTKRGGVEGVVGFARALTRSTDTFFYQVASLTTPEVIGDWAQKFGYGSKTGIEIYGEVAGLIATPEWKKKTLGEEWFLGNTYHMGIGQGDLLATPLQVNVMTNVIANGGKKCRPKLLIEGGVYCEEVEMSETVKKIVLEGMIGACSEGGTAFPLFGFVPQVACKTGTAEYVAPSGKMRTHAWLTAFAPANDPQISVTVLLEGGGEGSNAAAPVARQVLSKFFNVEDTYPYDRIPQEVGE